MVQNKKSNFYGTLLAFLMFFTLIALFTSEPEITGFVVKETEQSKADINVNEKRNNCVADIQHGSCSNTKPLYCDDGSLTYNCFECGCDEGLSCGEFGVCEELEKCADGSFYGECSFLNGKFCQDGTLVNNCELCGCNEGYACSNGKCIPQ